MEGIGQRAHPLLPQPRLALQCVGHDVRRPPRAHDVPPVRTDVQTRHGADHVQVFRRPLEIDGHVRVSADGVDGETIHYLIHEGIGRTVRTHPAREDDAVDDDRRPRRGRRRRRRRIRPEGYPQPAVFPVGTDVLDLRTVHDFERAATPPPAQIVHVYRGDAPPTPHRPQRIEPLGRRSVVEVGHATVRPTLVEPAFVQVEVPLDQRSAGAPDHGGSAAPPVRPLGRPPRPIPTCDGIRVSRS